mmetsp:Transcript_21935/g.67514  ORF Transcript_21935/g.67514 Transcript_21935/m.67514 type:complete len:211 (-) Transcript_21935:204-836(-)
MRPWASSPRVSSRNSSCVRVSPYCERILDSVASLCCSSGMAAMDPRAFRQTKVPPKRKTIANSLAASVVTWTSPKPTVVREAEDQYRASSTSTGFSRSQKKKAPPKVQHTKSKRLRFSFRRGSFLRVRRSFNSTAIWASTSQSSSPLFRRLSFSDCNSTSFFFKPSSSFFLSSKKPANVAPTKFPTTPAPRKNKTIAKTLSAREPGVTSP